MRASLSSRALVARARETARSDGRRHVARRARGGARRGVARAAYTPSDDGASADAGTSSEGAFGTADVDGTEDENALTTILNKAIFAEDYALAGRASAKLKRLQGMTDPREQLLDWRSLGLANWIASRAEDLGFRYPTAIQRRSALAMMRVNDVVISSQTGSGKTLAYLMPSVDGLNFVGRGMLQMVVIVPTRELVVQNSMLIWRILGGNVSKATPGDAANMFRYMGPRGVKVRGVFDLEKHVRNPDPDIAVAEIVVGTPEELRLLKLQGDLEVDLAQFIIADEADVLFEKHPEAMAELLKPSPYEQVMEDRCVCLSGVALSKDLVKSCTERGLMKEPIWITTGGGLRVPPGISHRMIVVKDRSRKLIALTRQLRKDLEEAGEDAPPPRTFIFVPNSAAAKTTAGPVRKALWGEHKLLMLLPEGTEALRVVQDFKENKASILVCTAESERGLDMPNIQYIYSLDAPSTSSYLHRAGRCGRLGTLTPGVVTSVVSEDEVKALKQAYVDLEINDVIELEELPPREYETAEETQQALLDDLFFLMDTNADVINSLEQIFEKSGTQDEDDDDEEEDEDED